ncbi:fructosyl amino acid oxidase [Aspergillus varians]
MAKSVIIVGAGAFGVSTAWHLSKDLGKPGCKYSSIQVLDRFPPPSQIAAATDINKIIRTEYSDPLYTELALVALHAWTDPKAIFNKHFHRTGWLLCTSGSNSVPFLEQSEQNARIKGVHGTRFMTSEEVRSAWPIINGPMSGWKVLADPEAGWAAAGKVLLEMAEQSAGRGVSFHSRDSGHAQDLLFDETGTCVGVCTVGGTTYHADHIILAAGANTASLLDLEGQQYALGHTVCFIHLLPEETKQYKNMTLIADIEEGCIFPPDENNIIKIASVHFVTNSKMSRIPGISLPRFREDNPGDGVPDAIQKRLRNWVRNVMPGLAERPWSETRICWEAQTPTDDFIISSHPRHQGLTIATGGSGHAFKFLPTLGSYVSQLLDGTLPEKLERKWRWASPTPTSRSTSPHMFTASVQDLADFPGWQLLAAKL